MSKRSRPRVHLPQLAATAATLLHRTRDNPVLAAQRALQSLTGAGRAQRWASRAGDLCVRRPSTASRSLATVLLTASGRAEEASHQVALLAADHAGPWRRLAARALLGFDHPTSALSVLEGDSSVGAIVLRARSLLRLGRLTPAIALLEEASDRQPRSRRLHDWLGRAHGERRALDVASPTRGTAPRAPSRTVLMLLTNSLPQKRAGYTMRSQAILRALSVAGVETQACTRLGFPLLDGHPLAPKLEVVDGVPYHRLRSRGPLPRAADRYLSRNVEAATAFAECVRPRVVHATTNHINGQTALQLGGLLGIPVVYEVRGFLEETWLTRPGASPDAELYRLLVEAEGAVMRAADAVLTLGTEMRREIAGRGVPEERIHLLPNAVDDSFLKATRDDARRTRAALGIPPDLPLVGAVSSLTAYEGLEILLMAVAELQQRGERLGVLIAGDGPAAAGLHAGAAQLRLRDVHVVGRRPAQEVPGLLAALSAVVIPRRDSRVTRLVTPMKPVEALAVGTPVIASNLPALAEIVRPGQTGELVTPGDPHALAAAISALLRNPERAAIMGAHGQDWVRRERTWQRIAATLRDLYDELAPVSQSVPPSPRRDPGASFTKKAGS